MLCRGCGVTINRGGYCDSEVCQAIEDDEEEAEDFEDEDGDEEDDEIEIEEDDEEDASEDFEDDEEDASEDDDSDSFYLSNGSGIVNHRPSHVCERLVRSSGLWCPYYHPRVSQRRS